MILLLLVIALCAVLFALYAFKQKREADSQANLARQKILEAQQLQMDALGERLNADSNKEKAKEQSELKLASDKLALRQKEIADSAALREEREKNEAIRQRLLAAQFQLAAENTSLEVRAKNRKVDSLQNDVWTQTKQAEIIRKNNNELQELASSRKRANESILLFNENNIDSSRQVAIKAFELNNDNNGPDQNNDIYKALNINWTKSINYKNTFAVHQQPVRSITGIPGSNFVFTADESGLVCESVLKNYSLQKIASSVMNGAVRALGVSPEGSRLVAITSSGNASVFNIAASGISQSAAFKFNGIGKSLCFINNQNFILLSSESICLYKLTSNVTLQSSIQQTGINALVIGRSGAIYIASGNQLKIYKNWNDLQNDAPATVRNFDSQVSSLAVDSNEEYLAAGTNNGYIWINKLKGDMLSPWSRALHLSVVRDLAFSVNENGKIQLASAGADKTIKLIDVKAALYQNSAENIVTISGHSKWVWKLYYTANAGMLLSTGEDNKVMAWKPSMLDLYQSLYNK